MRMAVGLLGLVLLLVLSAGAASAQQVVTLAELERKAVQNRPALDANDAATHGADADVQRALSGYYPVLAVEATGAFSPATRCKAAVLRGRRQDTATPKTSCPTSSTYGAAPAQKETTAWAGTAAPQTVFRYGLEARETRR